MGHVIRLFVLFQSHAIVCAVPPEIKKNFRIHGHSALALFRCAFVVLETTTLLNRDNNKKTFFFTLCNGGIK